MGACPYILFHDINGKVEWEGNKILGFDNDVLSFFATKFGFDYMATLPGAESYSLKKKKWMGPIGEVCINCH